MMNHHAVAERTEALSAVREGLCLEHCCNRVQKKIATKLEHAALVEHRFVP
jgi:hypothetical protein